MNKQLIDDIIDIYTHKYPSYYKYHGELTRDEFDYIFKMWRLDYEKACKLLKEWEVNMYDEILSADTYEDYCIERENGMPKEDFEFLKDVFW